MQAARETGTRRRQPVPEDGRAGDQEIAGLQGRRDDRDHVRPGATDRASTPTRAHAARARRRTRTCAACRPARRYRRPGRWDRPCPGRRPPTRPRPTRRRPTRRRPTRRPTDTTTTDTTTTDARRPTRPTTAPTTTTAPVSLGTGETTPTGGGGQVGLLLISPYVKANSIDVIDYFNHFSLLATIENMFGLHRLGYSGAPGLPLFSTGVFNNYSVRLAQ